MTENSENNRSPFSKAARLQIVLDAYGANPARWPADERADLLAVAATQPKTASAMAAQLDALLDQLPTPEVSANLTEKVLSMAPRAATADLNSSPTPGTLLSGLERAKSWLLGPIWQPAAAVAVLALFGVTLGMFTVPAPMVEIGDVNEIEVAWEVVFDPTDIQMASFVMEDWQ